MLYLIDLLCVYICCTDDFSLPLYLFIRVCEPFSPGRVE